MGIEAKGAFVFSTEVLPSVRPSPPDSVVLSPFVEKYQFAAINEGWANFNTGVIPCARGRFYISRAVPLPIYPNVPDENVLVVVWEDESGHAQRLPDLDLPIGRAEGQVRNWEDPRVHVKSQGNGTQVTLGLTAVKLERGGYGAYPSLVNLEIVDGQLEVRDQQVFSGRGKNVVPMDGRFIYRRESETHVLDLVRPTFGDSPIVEKYIDFSQFSDVFWIKKKIGAVARPIDLFTEKLCLFEDLMILPVHGVRNASFEEERGVDDVYAVGMAIIDKNWRVVALDSEPLFERDHFLDNLPISEDLNNKKRVVYCCDFIEEVDEIIFSLTVGDRITVFKNTPRKSLEERALKVLYAQS